MSAIKSVFELSDDRCELVAALADVAGILRTVRTTSSTIPDLCPLDCPAANRFTWGTATWCACGLRILPADAWHRLLTMALRANVATQSWNDWRNAA